MRASLAKVAVSEKGAGTIELSNFILLGLVPSLLCRRPGDGRLLGMADVEFLRGNKALRVPSAIHALQA